VATLIAVYGLFMTPLGWDWAGFVWAYALAWALVNERVKLIAYRIFGPTKAPLLANNAPDLTARIAKRPYELCEELDPGESPAEQDRLEAEREDRKEQPGRAKTASTSS
jgi:H+-transporting ATPase